MNLRIGLSALRASQFAINNISHNLANASTEGYHRQDVILQTNRADILQGRYVGTGVEVSEVRRYRDMVLESSFTNVTSELSRIDQGLLVESSIESIVAPGEGSIQNAFARMFDGFSRLSANPGENALRSSIVNDASNLASRIQSVQGQIVQLGDDVKGQIELEVQALNQDIELLIDIQNRIKVASNTDVPNDLLDQRDQLVNKIAERVDVQRYEHVQQQLGLGIAGSSISIGVVPVRFETYTDPLGDISVRIEGSDQKTDFQGGRIAALVEVNNQLIGDFSDKIDQFASQLINQFNQKHATGIGIDGGFSKLQAGYDIEDTSAVLAGNTTFPVSEGELAVTVMSPNGELRTTSITIDPQVDSMDSIAAKISGVENVQGIIDPNTGRLSVVATPGYKFDFTGRLETTPDTVNISGSAVPGISGDYTGDTNQVFQVTVIGSGEVGKTEGLQIQLADENGTILNQFSIGSDYEAGSPIEIGNGVSIQMGVGDLADGDSFEVKTIANSDTSGFLSAVGLNSFFDGTGSTNISLNQRIIDSPDAVATSLTGEVSDTRNLKSMLELRETQVLEGFSFEGFLSEVNSEIGFKVQSTTSIQVGLQDLKFEYQAKRESVSGVDVNEELINLTQYQKTYEAAVQVVRTMEAMMTELIQIIR